MIDRSYGELQTRQNQWIHICFPSVSKSKKEITQLERK